MRSVRPRWDSGCANAQQSDGCDLEDHIEFEQDSGILLKENTETIGLCRWYVWCLKEVFEPFGLLLYSLLEEDVHKCCFNLHRPKSSSNLGAEWGASLLCSQKWRYTPIRRTDARNRFLLSTRIGNGVK